MSNKRIKSINNNIIEVNFSANYIQVDFDSDFTYEQWCEWQKEDYDKAELFTGIQNLDNI